MLKSSLIVFFFAFFPAFCFAQKNFLDGGIIQRNGDTLLGQVNYQEWERNPSTIRFQAFGDGSPADYDCRDIAGFFISSRNEIYQSAVVYLNLEASGTSNLPAFRTVREALAGFQPVPDTVFLRVLARGRLNLFSYTDHIRRHYLVQPKADTIRELLFRRVLLDRSGGLEVLPMPEYRRQLALLTAPCPAPGIHLDKLAYQEKPLIEVIKRFNQCSQDLVFSKPVEKSGKLLYVLAGAAHPLFQISGPYTNGETVSAPGGVVPVLGFGGDFNFSRSRGRRGVGLEAYGSQYSITKASTEFGRDVKYHVDISYLRVFAFFRQNLLLGNIQPYLKAGAGASHYFKADYYYTKVIVLPDPVRYDRQMKKNDICLLGAAGVRMQRLALEIRYEWGNNLAFYDASDWTKGNILSVVASYGLFR